MENKEIRALLEGAYAQTPTLPGSWVKFEEYRTVFNNLVSQRSEMPYDFDSLIEEYFPEAAYEDAFQLNDSDDVFKAIRIAPNKLQLTKKLKREIEKSLSNASEVAAEGWKNFAVVGVAGLKPDILAMGFIGIRQAVETLYKARFEFRLGDPSKREAPVMIRDNKSSMEKEATSTRVGIRAKLKQGSYLGEALDSFAFFPKRNSATTYGWDEAVNDLAINIALKEDWYYEEKDQLTKPILKNYLSYTFERLTHEDREEVENAQKANRSPHLKIISNEKNAIFNTGLVDSIYDPIYAFFKRNDMSNPSVLQPWIFIAFGTANSRYQSIITDFAYKPDRAQYFTNPSDLFYDIRAEKPTLNWEHFFRDNIERLPLGFIKRGAPSGYLFIEDVLVLPKPQREAYYKKLAEDIYKDEDWLQFLTTSFKNALEVALHRVKWNYKTAIPVYHVKEKKLSLLLPLALEKKGIIDVALVCEHKYRPNEKVNNYVGRTIFTLQMAYTCARLITRPDSDWLMADKCRTL